MQPPKHLRLMHMTRQQLDRHVHQRPTRPGAAAVGPALPWPWLAAKQALEPDEPARVMTMEDVVFVRAVAAMGRLE